MYVTGAAARWLPSVEKKLKSYSWFEFSKLVLDRFGRDQHELLVRQFLTITQIGTLSEYIDKYSELVDQLTAYETQSDPLHLTMHLY